MNANAKLNQAKQTTNKQTDNIREPNGWNAFLWSTDLANHRISKEEIGARLWMVKFQS